MRIDSVSIQNFLSHKDTKLDFTGQRIQVAGLNGSGKTSAVVDAPLWALFGQARGGTTDQLKGPWDTKMRVSVKFTIGLKSYTVTRERGSSSGLSLYNDTDGVDMTEKHVAMTSEKIFQLIGSENAFTNTVIFKQGDGLRFAVMTPSERKNLIDELVGIEEYAQIESASNKHVKLSEQERKRFADEIDRITSAQNEAIAIRSSLVSDAKALDGLQERSRSVQSELDAADAELRAVQGAYTQRASLEGDARKAELAKLRMDGVIEAQQLTHSRVGEELRLISQGQPCPTCGSELDPTHPHVQKQVQALMYRVDEAAKAVKQYTDERSELIINAHNAQKLLDKADEQIKKRYEDAEKLKFNVQHDLATLNSQLTSDQRKYDAALGSVTVLERDISKLADFQASHDEQSRRSRAYGLISEAFSKRGIPRELKRGFVAEVERHTNAIVQSLGDFTVRLSMEKAGKEKNGISEGTLDVWVIDVAGERKLEMFSGGEKQRVSVALRLALATAMAKRTDRALKTLIIDEALDFLDQSGKDAVLSMIGSLSGFERMLFVTHDPAIAGLFPDRLEFAKTSDGSSVVL